MQIQKRLEQLEKDANIHSTNCACPREFRTRVILPDLDKSEEDRLREQEERMRPAYCDQCGKLIESRYIIINPVPLEIESPNDLGEADPW